MLASCADCFGLCCVALPFAASADFALDKDAGEPCRNLQGDNRCGIHRTLRQQGFPGCTVYDCFGAGQQVSQVTFGGLNWRQSPQIAPQMFTVFPIMRQLHELLWYLDEARALEPAADLLSLIVDALAEIDSLTSLEPAAVLQIDTAEHRRRVDVLLRRTSASVRSRINRSAERGGIEQCETTSGRRAGPGADLRATTVQGADLSSSLFLTQFQVNAAAGDAETRIPPVLTRPEHWSGVQPSSQY